MNQLNFLPISEDQLTGNWCNFDAVVSCTMEAVSFITPAVERFCIQTVTQALDRKSHSELGQRGRKFVLEEANHSRAHRRFNSALLAYLESPPPGFTVSQILLAIASKRASLSSQLLLAATLEHLSAVLSRRYLLCEGQWIFRSSFAKNLFAQHAREEIAHRAVAFDLWRNRTAEGATRRTLALIVVLTVAWGYFVVAVPWILYRKSGRRLSSTLSHLARFACRPRAEPWGPTLIRELFLFTRSDFHPRLLPLKDLSAVPTKPSCS